MLCLIICPMISYIFLIIDLFWSFFDVIYIYLDTFDVEILAKASELFFYDSPLFCRFVVIVTLPKSFPYIKIIIFRTIKFTYVLWNAIEFFTSND